MKKLGLSANETLAFVKSKRKQAYPNPGFLNQLQKYETYLNRSKATHPGMAKNKPAAHPVMTSHVNMLAKQPGMENIRGNQYGASPIINITNNNNYNMNFDEQRYAKPYGKHAMR